MKRSALAALLICWMSCDPGYESGKTKCSVTGTCPSGFVCGPGQVCITATGTTAGHGGAGGQAGSGNCPILSSDSTCTVCDKQTCCQQLDAYSNSTSCGDLVSCTLNCTTNSCAIGCANSYPAGVAQLDNWNGCLDTSCVGACGISPVDCSISSTATNCTKCDMQSCCTQFGACMESLGCLALVDCISSCTTTTCENNCLTSYPSGVTAFNNWNNCLNNSCNSACSSSGGSGGTGGTTVHTGGTAGSSSGGAGGSTVTCPASSSDSTCTQCDKLDCCSQLSSCSNNTSCVQLSTCVGNCSDSTCDINCAGSYAAGLASFDTWTICLNNNCSTACGGTTTTGCPISSSDSACTQCDKQSCCSQLNACSSSLACVSLVNCISNCTTTTCQNSCLTTYPSGVTAFNNWNTCLNNSCNSACSSSGGSGGTGGTTVRTGGTVGPGSTSGAGGVRTSGGSGGSGGSTVVSGGTTVGPGSGGSGGRSGTGGGSGTCPVPAAGGTCNVFPACGCPTGQVCYPDTQATGLVCTTTAGLGEGAACDALGCASGSGCFGSICKHYCQSDSDCTAVDGARSCEATYWYGTSNKIAGVSTCARVCDPVSPQNPRGSLLACPEGFGCYSSDSNPGASDCEQQYGTGLSGSTCTTDADCTPGYYCGVASNTCVKYCAVNTDCPTGKICEFFSTPQYAGTTQIGACESSSALFCNTGAGVTCGTGVCGSNTTCTTDNRCSCPTGYQMQACDGSLCNGDFTTKCPGSSWKCVKL